MPVGDYPDSALERLEIRFLDVVTGESFNYLPESWNDLSRAATHIAAHRGHDIEIWVALRDQVDPSADPDLLPIDEAGRVLPPWTKLGYTYRGEVWALNGPALGAALGAVELVELGDSSHEVEDDADDRFQLGAKVARRIPLDEARELALETARSIRPRPRRVMIVGSVRRKRPDVGDVELVVLPKDLDELVEQLREEGFSITGKLRRASKTVDGVRVDLYLAHDPDEFGAMAFHYTGDWLWNVAMRRQAIRKGWKLNQYGLFDRKTGKPVLQSREEKDFFKALGIRYHEPEERSLKDRRPASKPAGDERREDV